MRLSRDQSLAVGILGGLALLLFELRFEHREVLGETWRSWIPLLYSGATLLAGSVAIARWDKGGRRALAILFGVGVAVGLAGFWFHTGGHLVAGLRDVLAAWRIPFGQDGGIKIGSRPPALAPLAFCGIGTLGVLVCAAPRTARSTTPSS
jgi:hypothetical protein